MRIPTWVKLLIKVVLVPILSVHLLKYFNIFELIKEIPEENIFDLGLTAYLALFEGLFTFLENILDSYTAQIDCVFYSEKYYKNSKNSPRIVCGKTSTHVAYIYCDVHISGNVKLLRKTKFMLKLPTWVSSQISKNETVLSYSGDTLCWEFNELIANGNERECHADHTIRIPFIDALDGEVNSISSVILEPEIVGRLSKLRVSFKSNSFELCNREQ